MSEDKGQQGAAGKEGEGENKGEGEPYLGSWKTKEDAAEGLKHLQTKLSEQGNETGALRRQLEHGQMLLEQMNKKLAEVETKGSKSKENEGDDLEKAQQDIAKQISSLDPVDDDYSSKLMKLLQKSNEITARKTQSVVLQAATETFKKELNERDAQAAQKAFLDQNPEFSDPAIQARIQEYIAKDGTGMSDPLIAYREIQRDDIAAQAQELKARNEELQKLLDLKKGTDETGTVINKGQSTKEKTTHKKVTGAERDKGMEEILQKMKSA